MTWPQRRCSAAPTLTKPFCGGHTHGVAYAATSTGLFGDEARADHLTCELLRFLGAIAKGEALWRRQKVRDLRLDDVYSALKAVGEFPLSSSTCKNLRLDHCTALACHIDMSAAADARGAYKKCGRTSDVVESLDGLLG